MARAMKDSGIAWIGEIPEEWEIHRMKSCIESRTPGAWGDEAKGNDGDTICLRIADFDYSRFIFKNVPTDMLTIRNYDSETVERLKLKKGDILIEKSGGGEKTPVGRTVIFDKDYTALYANFMDRIRCSELVIDKWLQYVFVTFYKNNYTINYIKQTTGIQNLDLTAMLANESIPVPSTKIQHRIVAFLDTECARIDAVIEQTRASIEEYKKLKQAVITQAVTKGIRPNRPMKDSGIDWIGKVPCDWKVTKLKYFATIRSGITLGKVYPAGTKLVEYPYLRVANVQGSYTDLRDVATIAVTEEEAEKYRLHDGELLMTEGGDRDKLGRGTVWHAEIDPCLHQNHVFALRTNEKLLAEYVSYLSESLVGRDYFDVTANQSVHLASTNSTTILNFAIPYPLMDEQKAIVEYLKRKTMEIDIIMEKKQRLLFNVEAYKKSVIYEHVTGKKGDGSIEKTY